MADAIVSAVLQQLTSLMAQEMQEEVRLVVGVEKEVDVLAKNLRTMRAVLVDAEQRQVKEESIRLWLDQLKDASYDMEDVLDEWNTARLKLQIEGVENAIAQKKVCSFLTSSCFCFKQVSLRWDIAHKIKEINDNLGVIEKAKNKFNFSTSVIKSFDDKSERVPSISFIDESKIYGRDYEKIKLINILLCESSEEQKGFLVISIIGMGGLGKTTLAQLAYNDDRVKRNFEKVIWVCVSDPFDEFRIAKAIIEAITGKASNLRELESLMQFIHDSIERKKILLVLDDVWNEDYRKWEPFYNCLKNSFHGSKILITTRKESIARMMGSIDVISISQLTEEACWSLFKLIAFFGRSNEECQKLEEIGRNIVGKCKGLPLAAKSIASLMRSKKTEEEWQRILDSELWKLEESEKLGILAPLLLSYNDLPSAVKRCFSYCSLFPKDYNLDRDELIKLWMANGYLSIEQNKEMEMIGREYFDILAARSFFQEFEKDYDDCIIRCKMHDIVHDFSKFISKGECFAVEEHNGLEELLLQYSSKKNVFHSLLTIGENFSFPDSIYRLKRLRTLLIYRSSLTSKVLLESFDNLTSLRVCHVSMPYFPNEMTKLPNRVGKLIHLRYLTLSRQNIKRLPETLCELYNLQTLDISSCFRLEELPQGIGKLINMRHLLNDFTHSITYLPAGIARLTNLRTLKRFVVGRDVDGIKRCSLESLKNLNFLQECSIFGLSNVSDVEAKRTELEKRKNLHVLRLDFHWGEEGRKNEEDEELLEALKPPLNLKELQIAVYKGNIVQPSWMMSLTNLKVLKLDRCKNCVRLPPLGKLPSLERLSLCRMDCVKRVGNEFLGVDHESSSSVVPFPKLKSLEFMDMENWEEWDYGINRNGENSGILPRKLFRHTKVRLGWSECEWWMFYFSFSVFCE
ncbi:Disease resistance protein [Melia azedarach]|uniref:Disease resistance protein n=1 Tax=Melia azedarach TaxID=155640 RepID=A0ACC1Y535_MELAZ|nr:Disease resistance protein [Melia azedarach]